MYRSNFVLITDRCRKGIEVLGLIVYNKVAVMKTRSYATADTMRNPIVAISRNSQHFRNC